MTLAAGKPGASDWVWPSRNARFAFMLELSKLGIEAKAV
jgi:hypothetical protein